MAGVFELVSGDDSALGGVGWKTRAASESKVWALFGLVYIGAFYVFVSTVVTGVVCFVVWGRLW